MDGFDPRFMKKHSMMVVLCSALAAALVSGGCVAAIGNRGNAGVGCGTVGQQLIDLKKAHDSGAMSDAEFESERAKVLNHK